MLRFNKTIQQADWNPITLEEAQDHPINAYRLSKKLSEVAAWDFVKDEGLSYDIATINPSLVFGPVHPWIASLDSMNISNQVLFYCPLLPDWLHG